MAEATHVSPERARQVSALARALLAAVRSRSLYPPEHPAVTQAVERLQGAVAAAASPSGLLLGVAPDALLVSGAPLADRDGPVAEAAALLHDRDILSLSFAPEVPGDALARLLDVLTLDADERRRGGGPAAVWARTGHRAIEIEQVDYARVLEERPVVRAARRDALWQALVRAVGERRPILDEAAQQRLLEIAADPAAIAAFASDVTAPYCTPDGAPLLATQAAAVLAAYRHLLDIVAVLDPDRLDETTRHLAAATAELDPRVVLQMFQKTGEKPSDDAAGPDVVRRVGAAFDEAGAARLLATTLALEGRASERLAAVAETLAPDPARRQRMVKLARMLLAAGEFARSSEQIAALGTAIDELMLKANEQPFVSAEYRETLDQAAGRAHTLAARDLPPELPEWMATLDHDHVRHLSVTLLADLLRLETDASRAAELVGDIRHLAEDFLLAGDYALTHRAIEPLAQVAEQPEALASEAARAALHELATSAAYRDAAGLLGEMSEAEFEQFAALSRAVGAATVATLRDLLLTETPGRSGRRASTLIVAMGPPAVPHLAPLCDHPAWFVQRHGVILLRQIGSSHAVPILQKLLKGSDARVLREAVCALCRIDDPAAARAVRGALRTTAGEARRHLIEALGSEPDPRIVPLLGRVIDESDPFGRDHEVVLDAVNAVGRAGADQAIAPLVRLLYRRRWWARRRTRRLRHAAIGALLRIGSARANQALDEAGGRGDRMLRKMVKAARQATTAAP